MVRTRERDGGSGWRKEEGWNKTKKREREREREQISKWESRKTWRRERERVETGHGEFTKAGMRDTHRGEGKNAKGARKRARECATEETADNRVRKRERRR